LVVNVKDVRVGVNFNLLTKFILDLTGRDAEGRSGIMIYSNIQTNICSYAEIAICYMIS